jgi:hypothetical protein
MSLHVILTTFSYTYISQQKSLFKIKSKKMILHSVQSVNCQVLYNVHVGTVYSVATFSCSILNIIFNLFCPQAQHNTDFVWMFSVPGPGWAAWCEQRSAA